MASDDTTAFQSETTKTVGLIGMLLSRLNQEQLSPVSREMLLGFFVSVATKFVEAEKKHSWKDAWFNITAEGCQRELLRHVNKGDPLDAAVYCAFMNYFGWKTANPAILNLDTDFLQQISKAAREGRFKNVPPEYCLNDLVSDICVWLREPVE